jgi:hypothetical protein
MINRKVLRTFKEAAFPGPAVELGREGCLLAC